ncbi:MAG TPA: amino acid adenylation domain-containing protein, partial [Thermoanaerobaculia bacterium]|nr:amino acid adenylation domain-containing protein [Thermoanaerobaculia bacterium]
TPDAVALAFEGPDGRPGALTYGELHRRVDALAGRLEAAGAGPEQAVAVSLPRSPELVVALLAVLRTGACYVPVDPGLPAARRAALLAAVDPVAWMGAEGPVVEERRGTGGRSAGSVDRSDVPPEALAYVLFTSGSTGEPKGVTVTRGGLASYLAWAADAYPAGRGRGTPVHTAIGFDLTVTSLFVPLARGETVRLLPEEDGVTALAEALRDGGQDLVKVTPAHLSALAELLEPPALPGAAGALVVGGEALFGERLAPWREGDGDLGVFNEYGPTETVVGCVVHEVPHGERPVPGPVPIGRPIRGARVYAVDADLRPTPLAVPGELLVGGPGVARGYLGLPGATAERFVPDPLSGRPGARLYRTGDRVRWRPGGALEFLGRLDRQVKVRGHRLEPGEVEAALATHPGVREAVAELRDGRLVAWVAPRPDAPAEEVEPRSFRRFLEGWLPEHAIPAVFVPVASIPLTAHGKVDRRALPDPEAARAAVAGEAAPASAVEETLSAVWREVLGLDRVGVHDRFFELGGDSILALRAASRAAELGLRLEPRDLFEHPTIASLAAVVEGVPTGAAAPPAPVEGPVPLGPAQRRFLEELAPPVPDHWNLALLLEPRGALPMDGVARAVRRLLARHDMLRARFRRSRREAGRWRQVVVPPDAPSGVAAPAAAVDLSGLPRERASGALEDALAACQGSLDLARGPLLRLVRLDLPTATRLLLVAHHLVTDAVSLRVLLEDLARGQSAPPAPTAPYRAWVEALEAWAGSPEGAAEAAVWRERGRLPAGAVGAGRGGEGPWLERDAESLEAGLPAAPGREPLGRASARQRARPDAALLAGVAAALAAVGGGPEGGGRSVRMAV